MQIQQYLVYLLCKALWIPCLYDFRIYVYRMPMAFSLQFITNFFTYCRIISIFQIILWVKSVVCQKSYEMVHIKMVTLFPIGSKLIPPTHRTTIEN